MENNEKLTELIDNERHVLSYRVDNLIKNFHEEVGKCRIEIEPHYEEQEDGSYYFIFTKIKVEI